MCAIDTTLGVVALVLAALGAWRFNNTHVLKSPAPDVIFKGFGENSLDFALRTWTITQVRTPPVLRSQLYYAIFAAFRSEGINIPFPQRVLHLTPESQKRV